MSTLCPECGEPPHYHSFCTLCAELFWPSRQRCNRRIAKHERDKAFIRAYRASNSYEQVAEAVGLSYSRVTQRRDELGLHSFPPRTGMGEAQCTWLPEDDAALAAAISEGLTGKEAAARLERAYSSVTQRRRDLYLPKFKRPPSWKKGRRHPLAADVAKLRRAGLSYSQVAAKLAVSRNVVGSIIHMHLRHAEARP